MPTSPLSPPARVLRAGGVACLAAGLVLALPVAASASTVDEPAAAGAASLSIESPAESAVPAVEEAVLGTPQSFEVEEAVLGIPQSFEVEEAVLGIPQSFEVEEAVLGIPHSFEVEEAVLGIPQSFEVEEAVLGTPQSFEVEEAVLGTPQSFEVDAETGAPVGEQATEPQRGASDLAVALSGPAAGVTGETATFVVDVTNRSSAAAPVTSPFTVSVTSSSGLAVAGVVAGEDAWTCVLGQLSCTWSEGLAVGAAAPSLVLSVRFGPAAGEQRLEAAVTPGDDEGAALMGDNATSRAVVLTAPAVLTPAPATPAPAAPAPAPVAPAAAPAPAPVVPTASAPRVTVPAPAASSAPRPASTPAVAAAAGSGVVATGSTPTTLAFTGARTEGALALGILTVLSGIALAAAGRPRRTA